MGHTFSNPGAEKSRSPGDLAIRSPAPSPNRASGSPKSCPPPARSHCLVWPACLLVGDET